MILVDKVFQAVNGLANKDQRSSLTPIAYNSFASVAMADIVDDIRITIKNDQLGLLYGKLDQERLKYAQDALYNFYIIGASLTFSTDHYIVPADLESLEDLFHSGNKIDKLDSSKHLSLLRKMGKNLSPENEDAIANEYYLITGIGYVVYPVTVVADVTATYFRKWLYPKWTYTVVTGTPVYNGSAGDAQDFELPDRFFDDLVYRIAIMAGINIRDNELIKPLLIEGKKEEQENVS